jgi:fatty acid desaturase
MKAELKSLFTPQQISPFMKMGNMINIVSFLILFGITISIVALYSSFGNFYYIFFGFLIMGAVQHTLATFVHEAAHYSLFTNKKMNDFFGNLLCSAPLASYLNDYRYFHFEHHRHTGVIGKDPELNLYRAMGLTPKFRSKKEVAKIFFQDLTGISYFKSLIYLLRFFGEKRKLGLIEKPNWVENFCLMTWFVFIPILMWKMGLLLPFLIFWVLPLLTISPILLRWHGFGEHIRENSLSTPENTLTHKFGTIPTLFIYPINSSYHLEHHLYPQIPWYHLKKFYHWACKNEVYAQNSERLSADGFFIGRKTVVKLTFPIEK